jgi:osmotically inducible protein OsmC
MQAAAFAERAGAPRRAQLHKGEQAMKRTASASWSGGLKDGKGSISTQSGVLSNTQYGFNTRFENGPGTNPEELIAAAHAGCFTMALSAQLGEAGMTAENLTTSAAVTLDKVEGGFAITAIHLDLVAKIPGADQKAFEEAANKAKAGCPVSKVLNATITMNAKLES